MNKRIFLTVISKAQMVNREIHVALLKDYFVSKIANLYTVYTCCLIQSCLSLNTTSIASIYNEKVKKKTRLMNYLPMSYD